MKNSQGLLLAFFFSCPVHPFSQYPPPVPVDKSLL